MDYADFLQSKHLVDPPTGITMDRSRLPSQLYDFQSDLAQWALQRGRAGLFASTGLGKGLIALAYASAIPGKRLIVAPLAVAKQFLHEAQKLDLDLTYVPQKEYISHDGMYVTNYDRLKLFVGAHLDAIICDESAIMKHLGTQTRNLLIQEFTHIPYRLCCTAMPAPNDIEELGNHAEFLGVMTMNTMRATFFVHDQDGWRLRGHATDAFYRWLASWAMALRTPEDLGYDGQLFHLPPHMIHEHFLPWDGSRLLADGEGQFGIAGTQKLHGIGDRLAVRQQTVKLRAEYAAALARAAEGQVILWCGLDEESRYLESILKHDDAVEVHGSHPQQIKEDRLEAFVDGKYRLLITKARICGWGMNFQNATTGIFVGLNDSQELFYQAVRRLWRYRQTLPVHTHVVLSEHERPIWENVQRKETEALQLLDGLIQAMRSYEQEALHAHVSTGILSHRFPLKRPSWL